MSSDANSLLRSVLLSLSLLTLTASAQATTSDSEPGGTRLWVEVTGCSQRPPQRSFVTALGLELMTLEEPVPLIVRNSGAAEREPRRPPVSLRVHECELHSGRLLLLIERDATVAGPEPRAEQRQLDLTDVPLVARERTAAVAISEIARWLLGPLAATPLERTGHESAVRAARLSAEDAAVSSSAEGASFISDRATGLAHTAAGPRSRWSAWGALRAGALGEPRPWFYGARAGLALALSRRLHSSLGAVYQHHAQETRIGDVTLNGAGATVGADLALGLEMPAIRLGVNLEWLWLHVQGDSALNLVEAPVTVSALNAALRCVIEAPVSTQLNLYSEVELAKGLTPTTLTAGGQPVLSLNGLSPRFGVGVRWSL